MAPSRDRQLFPTYVAPMSSLLGTGGIGLLVPDAVLPDILSVGNQRSQALAEGNERPRDDRGVRGETAR
jgi:hypothetical protein